MKQRHLLYTSAFALLGLPALAQSTSPAPAAVVTELDTVTVSAARDAAVTYTAPVSATGGLKTDTPLLETPQAVSVLSEAIIRDQDATKLEEVIRNVAGVSVGGTYEGWDYYRIRGFDSAFNTFWDGLRNDYGRSPELYGLERVEVIKGPASTLYGQAPLGGLVNLVSKRPKHEFFGELGFSGGTWDRYEGTFDINVPLLVPTSNAITPPAAKGAKQVQPVSAPTTDSGLGIYARLTALYNNSGSYVDYVDTERVFIAPAITFEWDDTTRLTILASYMRDTGISAMPLPAVGTVLHSPFGEIPVSRYLGLPDSGTNEYDFRRYRVGYDFEHDFNEVFTIRQNLVYSRMEQDWNDMLYNSHLDPDGRTLYQYPYDYAETMNRFAVDTALDAKFETGSVKHTLTLGVDYYWSESKDRSSQINYDDPASYFAIDIFRPVYQGSIPGYGFNTATRTEYSNLGFYIQEHAKLTDQLTLTLGGRYDKAWYETGDGIEDDKDAFTPKAGITFEFVPGLAAYANYSRSFKPQWFSTTTNGAAVDPEEGENWEAGFKYNLLEGRVTGLLSVYQLTRENVATSNLGTPDPFDATVSGEQRSRGFEFETAAELAPGLTLSTAYSYIDAEVTKDNDIPVGTSLQGVPEHSANAWLKYTVQDGPLKGFGVGVGGRYYSSQSGDTYNTFDLPSYGIVDTALYYERDDFRVQVNFNNVFDKRHFVGSYDSLYVLPGKPFNVSASVTWKF
ncbi:TonB-dependent siderophore receptor [Verrucomicrobium sp. BvORR106]|uniref:TonB-dependent siderophore receptor n=1 Tax=Verrucomicrobium sp. BvORR106 TaxID=1403819 RepID=UPI00056E8CD4|nr:TonB-dependent siderophore receptor [Verrucomicrobium sp. BvORR106]